MNVDKYGQMAKAYDRISEELVDKFRTVIDGHPQLSRLSDATRRDMADTAGHNAMTMIEPGDFEKLIK